jgi:hypothetical protein
VPHHGAGLEFCQILFSTIFQGRPALHPARGAVVFPFAAAPLPGVLPPLNPVPEAVVLPGTYGWLAARSAQAGVGLPELPAPLTADRQISELVFNPFSHWERLASKKVLDKKNLLPEILPRAENQNKSQMLSETIAELPSFCWIINEKGNHGSHLQE